jgi:hypothetical protein
MTGMGSSTTGLGPTRIQLLREAAVRDSRRLGGILDRAGVLNHAPAFRSIFKALTGQSATELRQAAGMYPPTPLDALDEEQLQAYRASLDIICASFEARPPESDVDILVTCTKAAAAVRARLLSSPDRAA